MSCIKPAASFGSLEAVDPAPRRDGRPPSVRLGERPVTRCEHADQHALSTKILNLAYPRITSLVLSGVIRQIVVSTT
jgi:hypothetical protein